MSSPWSPDPTIVDHLAWARHRGLVPGSLKQRRWHLERLSSWLRAHCGRELLDAEGEDLYEWQLSLGYLADTSRAGRVSHARAYYRWASEWERCSAAPLRYLVAPKVRTGLPRPIPVDELLHAIHVAPARMRPWLLLGAGAGLRACEVAQLRADHLVPMPDGQVIVHVFEGKGGKDRVVPALAGTGAALRRCGLPGRGWLFPALDRCGEITADHVSAGQVSHLASAFLHETGSPSTFHALRHRFITDFYAASRDLSLTQDVAGHSDPRETNRYIALVPGRAAEVAGQVPLLQAA